MRRYAGLCTSRRLWLATAFCCLLVMAIGAASAQAANHGRWHSHRKAYFRSPGVAMPGHGLHHANPSRPALLLGAAPSNGLPAGIPACNSVPSSALAECDLTYHTSPSPGTVMLTNTTHLVFWAPSGYTYPSGYESLIERYLTDVAADSGFPTNTNSVATQYYQAPSSTDQFIAYNSTYAGALTDTDAYPAATSTCTGLEGTATACLTETQETTELDSFINSNSLPRGLGDIYFLVLPPAVQTCFDDYSDCGPYGVGQPDSSGNTNEYCAYHNAFTSGFDSQTTIWANMPYDAGETPFSCPNSQPNNNTADNTIDVLSHEMNEAITDPQINAWFDDNTTNGGEIGDQCNFDYGPALGTTSTGGAYDELVNHDTYEVQQQWSNASPGCVMNYGAVAPTAAFSDSPPSPHALDSVSFDGSASKSNDTGGYLISYSWDFGDGSSGSGATPSHTYSASGTYTVTLTVTDDAGQTAQISHDVDVVTRPTTLKYTGDTTGDYHDSVTLSATLTDTATAAAISGESVQFTLGSQSCSGNTNGSGDASCTLTLDQPSGGYTAKASFAGDSVYTSGDDSAAFSITTEETTIAYTGPITILSGGSGATLSATLVQDGSNDNDGDPGSSATDPSESVTLTLGSQSCTGMTGSTGAVSCTIPSVSVPLGPETVGAGFAGDSYYQPANATENAIVFAFPSRGAFTLGDNTVGSAGSSTVVTFWADQWSGLNRLSGGNAPASYKGFAATVSSLPTSTPVGTCGTSFVTSPGDSPPPTSSVPSYMGVLVTSKVTKSGSSIRGQFAHIVVVKTNPGYAPDPSDHGTGTIVASYC